MNENKKWLDLAHSYAEKNSTCAKVHVGSVIIAKVEGIVDIPMYGCNNGTLNCRKNGCRRVRLYGDNSKKHRLPSDCDALHSEIDAISKAAKSGIPLKGATLYVTRYPCEACARAIVAAGISHVVYGRTEDISEYTNLILSNAGVTITKEDWTKEDDNG